MRILALTLLIFAALIAAWFAAAQEGPQTQGMRFAPGYAKGLEQARQTGKPLLVIFR